MCHKWPRICSVCRNHNPRSFPHSWLIIDFVTTVTWRVVLVEHDLPTIPWHLSSSPVFSGVHIAQSLVFCVMCSISLFLLFHLVIVLSVLLRFTDSDYPFGILKLFLNTQSLLQLQCKIKHDYYHTFVVYWLIRVTPSWSWSYGSWIYNYMCNQWLLPLKL